MNVSSPQFLTYYPLDPLVDESNANAVKILVRFSNGDPAFVERKVGLGKVILAASSAGAVSIEAAPEADLRSPGLSTRLLSG